MNTEKVTVTLEGRPWLGASYSAVTSWAAGGSLHSFCISALSSAEQALLGLQRDLRTEAARVCQAQIGGASLKGLSEENERRPAHRLKDAAVC